MKLSSGDLKSIKDMAMANYTANAVDKTLGADAFVVECYLEAFNDYMSKNKKTLLAIPNSLMYKELEDYKVTT